MKPVDMISEYNPIDNKSGDCWRACIASLLELSVNDVPHFVGEYGNRYMEKTRKWLNERGFGLVETRYHGGYNSFLIASGPSPRSKDVTHSVIWQNGKMVHDPHPSRAGLWGLPYDYSILVPLDITEIGRLRAAIDHWAACECGKITDLDEIIRAHEGLLDLASVEVGCAESSNNPQRFEKCSACGGSGWLER